MYQKYLVLVLVVACGDVSLQFAACEVQVVIAAVRSYLLSHVDDDVVANHREMVGLRAHEAVLTRKHERVVAYFVDSEGDLCHGITVQRSCQVVAQVKWLRIDGCCHCWSDINDAIISVSLVVNSCISDTADRTGINSVHRMTEKR